MQAVSTALEEWRAGGRSWRFGAHDIFLREAGAGVGLLMVHGFPTASWDWHKVFPPLAARFRVVAPDMLGFGFSDKPKNGDYSTVAQARLHAALLADLNIRETHVLTYSFGASVVQQMLADTLRGASPLTIHTVTFLNGGLFPGSNYPNRSQRLLLSPIGPLIARLMGKSSLSAGLRSIFGPETQPDQRLIDDYWALLNAKGGRFLLPQLIGYLRERRTRATAWREALSAHPARKQLIVGMTDTISGPDMATEYRQTVAEAHVLELPLIGHYPQLEAPDRVVDAVIEIAR